MTPCPTTRKVMVPTVLRSGDQIVFDSNSQELNPQEKDQARAIYNKSAANFKGCP